MLLLGIDSQFAYIETLATALADAGWGERLPRPALAGGPPFRLLCSCVSAYLAVDFYGKDSRFQKVLLHAGVICLVSYLLGLVFVTRAGIYFLDLSGAERLEPARLDTRVSNQVSIQSASKV